MQYPPGALDGVRILDLSRVLAGPYATMLLADMGAEVIKVERPGIGDETRAWAPPKAEDGTSTYFASVNRNKRSVTASLSDPDDADALRRLARQADVVIENSRAGTLDRYTLGYADLKRENPALVYCSITGFGAKAGADLPGFDLLVQAASGLMSITGEADGEPSKVGVALVDVITGLHAVTAILSAIIERDRGGSGEGQHVEVNLLSSALSALVNQASAYVAGGAEPARMGNAHPSIAPYEVVHTADRAMTLAVGTDRQFAALAEAIDMPEIATDARFAENAARVANRTELLPLLEGALAERSAAEWSEVFRARGIPASVINTVSEAFAFAEGLELDPVIEIESDGIRHRQVANPITFSRTPVRYSSPPPGVGPRIRADETFAGDNPKEA
ncbi:CaiB/BaiF CoA transferase family protein [Agrococcus casei]|uniref:CaiB/BaiF CoA transferase family protein n=1 Tax=Agrococcus casei TaxID=343512 RepID=UPI003F99E3B4